jgi:hypothetical protein
MALAVVLAVRSTLDHRPVNPSVAAFSTDSMVNQLALNSPYSLLYALYEHHRDNKEQGLHYGDMDDARAVSLVLADAGIPTASDHDPNHPAPSPGHFPNPNRITCHYPEVLAGLVRRLGGRILHLTKQMAGQGIWPGRHMQTRLIRGARVSWGSPPSSQQCMN